MRIFATAGHVDHGKSSLVKTITGTDPDRLEEEKRRGLTIDLGFAFAQVNDETIGFIDVPGHVRFLRNMLAGIGAIDACVFVVAANEGWKPQSEEHLRILDALGIANGVIVITKIDLVDEDALTIVINSVRKRVRDTFLEHAQVICTSLSRPDTVEILRCAIGEMAVGLPRADKTNRARIWVDRAFVIRGTGTVVTGTLTGSSISVGDELVLLPKQRLVKIRAIQSNGADTNVLTAGNRCALNITGAEHQDIDRGDVLVVDNHWIPTSRFDASLAVLPYLDHDVTKRGSYMIYIGSREIPIFLQIVGGSRIGCGDSGFIRITTQVELPLTPGDRFILRESGRDETVGGGEVLDIHPRLKISSATPNKDVLRIVAERQWLELSQLHLLAGRTVETEEVEQVVGGWVTTNATLSATKQQITAKVADSQSVGVDVSSFSDHERLVLPTIGGVIVRGGRARSADFIDITAHPIAEQFARAGCTPPDHDALDHTVIRQLVQRGVLVHCDELYFHSSAIAAATESARLLFAKYPDGFTVAQFREHLGVSRKYALPLINQLDASGMTRRRDNLRIPGPRL